MPQWIVSAAAWVSARSQWIFLENNKLRNVSKMFNAVSTANRKKETLKRGEFKILFMFNYEKNGT